MSHLSQIRLVIDPDHSGRAFDAMLHQSGAAQDLGDLTIVTKDIGTKGGAAIACIAFTAVIDGKPKLVQTVATVRNLQASLAILNQAYPPDA